MGKSVTTDYKISSQDEQLLHLADAVIHPVLMERRDWVSTYDSMPDQALAVKKRLLDRAAAEEILVFGAHFPFPGLGYVRQRKNGWTWVPVFEIIRSSRQRGSSGRQR